MKQNNEDSLILDESSWETETQEKQKTTTKNISEVGSMSHQEVMDYFEEEEETYKVVFPKDGAKYLARDKENNQYEANKKVSFTDTYSSKRLFEKIVDGDKVNIAKYFTTEAEVYRGINFDPTTTDRKVKGRFNTFSGYLATPKAGDVSAMLLYTKMAWGDGAEREFALNYIAQMVQHPGHKPETLIAFLGLMKTGKSIVGVMVKKMLGSKLCGITSKAKHITGNFNAILEDKLLVFLEEVSIKDKASNDVLKHITSSKTIEIELKGYDVIEKDNYSRVIITTNDEIPAISKADERRNVFIRTRDENSNAARKNNPFGPEAEAEREFHKFMKQPDVGDILLNYFLNERIVAEDIVDEIIATEAGDEIKLVSAEWDIKFLETLIQYGNVNEVYINSEIPASTLIEGVREFVLSNPSNKNKWAPTGTKIGTRFGQLLGKDGKKRLSGGKGNVYIIPSREALLEIIKDSLNLLKIPKIEVIANEEADLQEADF